MEGMNVLLLRPRISCNLTSTLLPRQSPLSFDIHCPCTALRFPSNDLAVPSPLQSDGNPEVGNDLLMPRCNWASIGEVPFHDLDPVPTMSFHRVPEYYILRSSLISKVASDFPLGAMPDGTRTSARDQRPRSRSGFKTSCHLREHSARLLSNRH